MLFSNNQPRCATSGCTKPGIFWVGDAAYCYAHAKKAAGWSKRHG